MDGWMDGWTNAEEDKFSSTFVMKHKKIKINLCDSKHTYFLS